MILETTLVVYIGLHVLGDFYFQSDRVAEGKRNAFSLVVLHSLFYCVPFFLVLVFGDLFAFLTLVISHFLIDTIKYSVEHKLGRQGLVFAIDQAFHLLVLCLVAFAFPLSIASLVRYEMQIRTFVLLLAVGKPVSVVFIQLFGFLKPGDLQEGKSGAGRTIGYLERLLLASLFLLGQLGAIGWVIAAKAFARSRQISESPAFCEYFLVGTLFSLLSVVVLYGVLLR
jgi:hypothetical protein